MAPSRCFIVRTYGTRKKWFNPIPANELAGYYQIDPLGRNYLPVTTGGYFQAIPTGRKIFKFKTRNPKQIQRFKV